MIINYLDSICRITVDEFNLISKQERLETSKEKEKYVVEYIQERDIVFRLGSAFRQMAQFRTVGSDIQIPYKHFQIEVKCWRYWFNNEGTYSGRAKLPWKYSKKDFSWLFHEISIGNKGKVAFVACWSPVIPWNELIHFGKGKGRNPEINDSRIGLFPFLTYSKGQRLETITRDNSLTSGSFPLPQVVRNSMDFALQISSEFNIDWKVYGTSEDLINLIVYY